MSTVVIGGGFSGLAAAVALASSGRQVQLCEARHRLGGRATAYRDPRTGERVDNGQHVLLGCYHETLRLLRRIGAEDRVRRQPSLDLLFIDRAGHRSRLRCPPTPAPLHLIGALADWEAIGPKDLWAALRLGASLRRVRRHPESAGSPPIVHLGETVDGWLARHGQTSRLHEMLWEPLALAALNQPPATAAAPAFVRVLAEMFGGDAGNAAVVLPTRPLDETYVEPSVRYLEQRQGEVMTGVPAHVVCRGDRIDHVLAGDRRIDADSVIVAVPWFALPRAIRRPPAPLAKTLEAAAATGASPIVTVNLWFDRPVLDEPLVGLPGRTMQWVFDKSQMFGASAASHLSLVCSGAPEVLARTNADLVAEAVSELVEALPVARQARLKHGSVVRTPRATFSLGPGQPARPGVHTVVRGLFLAGDWIDNGLPATIEGAVVNGHRAAAAVLESTDQT